MTDIRRSNGPERDRASTLRVNRLSQPCPQGVFQLLQSRGKASWGRGCPFLSLFLTRVDCFTRLLFSVEFVLLKANSRLRVVFGIERGQRVN